MDVRERFRRGIDRDEHLLVPAVHDGLTARIADQVGFDAVGLSGYGVSLSRLGLPDAGFVTREQMVSSARVLAETVDAPVLTDVDTGFGNAISARRTARELVTNTPVAGLFMEDQVAPKRCGHVAGKEVLPVEVAVGKFRAVCDVRDELDESFVVVARTDARGAVNGSVEDAIERGNAYADAGADVIFVEGPTDEAEVVKIGKAVDAPLLYNQAGVSPYVDEATLAENGYAMSLVVASLFPTMVAVYDHLRNLREEGVAAEEAFQESIEDHPNSDLHEFSGFDGIHELEQQYLPDATPDRYENSVGYGAGEE